MSKLHDIFIDHYGKELLAPNSNEMEQAIKQLMLEIVDNTMLYSGGMPDASISLSEIRQKIKDL